MPEDTKNAGNYTPITQALRVRLSVTTLGLATHMFNGLMAECDNIDALHEALEDENAKLRKELKERPMVGDAEVMAFVDRLTDAAEKREEVTILGVDYTALPLDADGVPIHVGDMMHGTCPSGKYVRGEVSAIGNNKFWLCNVQFSLRPDYMRHYYKPTVADLLRDMLHDWFYADTEEEGAEIVERFAKRLQLADGDAE